MIMNAMIQIPVQIKKFIHWACIISLSLWSINVYDMLADTCVRRNSKPQLYIYMNIDIQTFS